MPEKIAGIRCRLFRITAAREVDGVVRDPGIPSPEICAQAARTGIERNPGFEIQASSKITQGEDFAMVGILSSASVDGNPAQGPQTSCRPLR